MARIFIAWLLVSGLGCIAQARVAFAEAGEAESNAAFASALAATCTGCHSSNNQVVPSLQERTMAEVENLLLAYKRGERVGTVMNRIARGYTDHELKLIAGVYGQ